MWLFRFFFFFFFFFKALICPLHLVPLLQNRKIVKGFKHWHSNHYDFNWVLSLTKCFQQPWEFSSTACDVFKKTVLPPHSSVFTCYLEQWAEIHHALTVIHPDIWPLTWKVVERATWRRAWMQLKVGGTSHYHLGNHLSPSSLLFAHCLPADVTQSDHAFHYARLYRSNL